MHYESERKNSNFKFLAGCFAIWKFEICQQKWNFKLLESTRCGYSKRPHFNHDHRKAIQNKIWGPHTEKSSKTVQICTPEHSDQIWTVFGQFLGMGTSEFYLDLFSVIVVQMRSFWIPTSGTFEQLEFSLLLRYFKFSNGEAPS